MKKYNPQLGTLIATVVTLSVIPIRLSEGQGKNPLNLIGSEIVIWIMCLTIWVATYQVYYRLNLRKWNKIIVALLVCATLSNLFYWTSNPIFEDYPVKPMREFPLWIATIRLSIRGVLIGLIIVPIIFLIENERQRQREDLAREKERVKDAEHQKQLLEALVSERTKELERTLEILSNSQDELDHQVYLLSRVVASIAHDVNAPLKYIISGAARIGHLISHGELEEASAYNRQLEKSLSNIASFMHNLLDFAREQIHSGSLHMGDVYLVSLIREKARLFEQILQSKENTLNIAVDERVSVVSNANLLGVIIHNLLDNAAKNTETGKIEIFTSYIDRELHLVVQNTLSMTPGNPDVNTDGLNTPSPWDISNAEADRGGLGLILVRDISALLNIRFSIESDAGRVSARIVFKEF